MVKAFKFGDDLWDPSHRFETSWLIPPYALFACRALFVSLFRSMSGAMLFHARTDSRWNLRLHKVAQTPRLYDPDANLVFLS